MITGKWTAQLRACVAVGFLAVSVWMPPAAVQAQGSVVPPNGTLSAEVVDLSVQTSLGPVEWKRSFNGTGWRFNRQWDGISASYKPVMTQNTGGGSPTYSANASGDRAVCWIWVDEDWQPGDGVAGLTSGNNIQQPLSPESYLPPNHGYNQTAVPLDQIISTGFASACGSIGGNITGNSSQVFEGWRRQSQLYVGAGGTYIFKNRFLLKKQPVQKLPIWSAAPTGGSVSLTGLQNIANGWRWSDKSGDWSEYDDEGRISRYGDKNDNTVWLQRDGSGRVVRIIDGGTAPATSGNVLITLHYDAAGFLTQAKDWPQAGNSLDLPQRTVSYAYDSMGRMTVATDVRGQATRYDYDNRLRLTQTTDPRGGQTKLTYEDEGGTVKSMTAADGGTTDYSSSWDNTKKLFYSKVQGPATSAGRRVEDYSHDRAGDLVRYEVNGRTEIDIKRDPVARTETRTNARGFATIYTRNEFEQVTQIQYPDGAKTAMTYEARLLNPVEETDELGVKTRYEYDTKGNLTKIIEAVGTPDERATEYQLDAAGRPTGITRKGRTEANGTVTPDATWQIAYDGSGQISQTTDPEGHKRGYVYSRAGDLLAYTDPQGRVWRYTYDGDGNVLSETDPLDHKTSYVYDESGNLASATDERGKVYKFAYDASNRQTLRTDPLGGQYQTRFNLQGVMSGVTDASGKAMSLDYDAMVRLTKATDSKGQNYGLDYADPDGSEKNASRPTRLTYPTFQRSMRYDSRDRLTLRSDQAGAQTRIESYTWDGASRQNTYTDANGKTKYYSYTPFGEVSEVKDPLGNTMRLVRDTRGNVIEVTDPNGRTTRMAYDRRNLLTSSADPLGKTTRYTYDDNGWLATIEQANGQKVAYDFDPLGRVTSQSEYDAQAALKKTTTFTYDAAGNLLTWNDGTYSATRAYDDADRLSSETVKLGAFELTHGYTYHANGQIKTYTGPDGATIDYDYDAAAQLERVNIPGAGTLSVADWQWFQPKKIILPGGVEQRMEYDGYQSLTRLKVVNPAQATVFDLQNQFGKLAEIQKATVDGNALDYTHDDAGRLTTVNASLLSGRSESFTLDANSNRKTHSKTGSGQWTYDDAGQLAQRPSAGGSGTVSYQYDAAGNLTQKTDTAKAEPARTTRYTWDALNRLAEVRDNAGALIARYTYDPFDRRIKKELGDSATLQTAGEGAKDLRNTTTHYLQSEWGTLAETDAAGQIRIAYGWSPQRDSGVAPIFARLPDAAQADTWRTVYYHNDHLGTPQRITDPSGTVVWSATYDAFGKAATQTTADVATAVISNLRFPGQYWDAETGLHYNDRRYYDPDTGRYTARDPLGFEGGINLYTYAAGAPGRYTDPTGEIIPCLAANYVRCMAVCGLQSLAMHGLDRAMGGCNEFDLMGAAKDCAVDCLWAMLPIPDPCGKFGKLFSTAIGLGAGLMNSFPGETLVHARDKNGQPILKPIAQIRVGDEVLAWDEMALVDGQLSQRRPVKLDASRAEARPSKATRYEKVSDIATSEKEQRLVHITLDSGEKLTATDGHPFRTSEGWRDAILLKRGGKLLLKGSGEGDDDSAGAATIAAVEIETRVVRVFNLEVDNLHTFFVGEEGVVVHNGVCTPKMRREWEKLHGRPWPKNPMTEKIRPGGNQDGHHIEPVARGGHKTDPANITPMTPSEHMAWHKANGYK